jgi:hypothetical protein
VQATGHCNELTRLLAPDCRSLRLELPIGDCVKHGGAHCPRVVFIRLSAAADEQGLIETCKARCVTP